MPNVFLIKDGRYSITTDTTNELPHYSPTAHLSRLKDHSDLDKVAIIDERTFTLNLPAITTQDRVWSYTLGAHGRPGQPWIIGRITVKSVPIAFTGSVCVHQATADDKWTNDYFGRFLSLGVTNTSIVVHEYAVQTNSGTGAVIGRPAQSFSITCYISDILL